METYPIVKTAALLKIQAITAALGVWFMLGCFAWAQGYDYGDAHHTFKTIGEDAARHRITGLYLGDSVSPDDDGKPSSAAHKDDFDDGVLFVDPWFGGFSARLEVRASARGVLQAWADFDGDGTFYGAGDTLIEDRVLKRGKNTVCLSIPFGGDGRVIYVRFRISSTEALPWYGDASDGEVEDYIVAYNEFTPNLPFDRCHERRLGG